MEGISVKTNKGEGVTHMTLYKDSSLVIKTYFMKKPKPRKPKYKVGDNIIIEDGHALARAMNPKGNIQVAITKILDDNMRFRGKTLFNTCEYVYDFAEIILLKKKKVKVMLV